MDKPVFLHLRLALEVLGKDHTGFGEQREEAREECYEYIWTRQGDLEGMQPVFVLVLSCAASSWLGVKESNTPVSVWHAPFTYYQVSLGALNGLLLCSVIFLLFFSEEVRNHLQI